jgi:uncharacterized RDD family membrane protein YckC
MPQNELQVLPRGPFRLEMERNTARRLEVETLNPYAAPSNQNTKGPAAPSLNNDPLATRGSRLGAYMLDALLALLAFLPGAVVGAVVMGVDEKNTGFLAFGALTWLIFEIYQWHLVATTGQSLAKRWGNIRIVDSEGNAPGFVRGVLLRSWVMGLLRFIPAVGSVVSLVDCVMIFGDEQRCLHDRLAGTRVVQD